MELTRSTSAAPAVPRARSPRRERRDLFGLTIVPALLVLASVTIAPTIYLLVTSLTSLDLSRPDSFRFVGLANYSEALHDPRFWNSLTVQAKLSAATVSAQMLLGLGVALLLNRTVPRIELLRAAFIIPMVLPPVVVAIIWKVMFNPLLTPLNFITLPLGVVQPSWLTHAKLALWTIVLADVWEWFPFTTFILLAALQSVPEELLEAARIDRATVWQEFIWVVLPLLRPALLVAGLFRLIDSFKAFPLIYIMTAGGPGTATETTNYYAFLEGFQFTFIGYASTLTTLGLIVTVVLSAVVLRLPGMTTDVE